MPMLSEGDQAPSFDLPVDTLGDAPTLSSESLAGKPYVIYFYPRDNTPGCTTEACGFRDNMARVTAAGAAVVGVSSDSVKKHDNFKKKYELNFPLIADTEKTLHQAYGAWGIKKMYGKEYEGTIRSTFLVGADGVIKKVWPKVKVKGHVDEVLEALEALQS